MANIGTAAFTPGSGSLAQVLTMLRKLAVSKTMNAEIAAGAATQIPGAVVLTLNQRAARPAGTIPAAPFETVDLAEEALTADTRWIPSSIAKAIVGSTAEVTAPLPVVHLLTTTGSAAWEEADVREDHYRISAHIYTGGDQERFVWHSSLLLAEAYRRVLRRDDTLGGLVKWMRVSSPDEAVAVRHPAAPVVMVSHVAIEATVILP